MSLRWGGGERATVEPVSLGGGEEGEGCCRIGESEGGGRRERATVEPVSLRGGGGRGLL